MNSQARVALCIACWSFASPVAADADKQPFVVVPVLVEAWLPVANAKALTGAFEAELASVNEHVLTNDDAAEQIRAHSAEPGALDAASLEEVKRSLRVAETALSVEHSSPNQPLNPERVLRDLPVEKRDRAARDPATERKMEAICLTELEYQLRHRAMGQAAAQARLCEELFPALQPDPTAYPPEVLSAFASTPRKAVRVDGGPSGCAIVLNGKDVGVAPATLSVFPVTGRLQLRCDGHLTRVHVVDFGERNRVTIDPAADAAIHTEHGLYLTGRAAPIATIGEWLGAHVVPLRVMVLDGRIRVQLMAAATASESTVRTLWFDLFHGYNKSDVADAVAELVHKPITPAATSSEQSDATQADPPGDGFWPTGPVVLAGAGVAMLAAGLVTGLVGHARDADVRHFAQMCPAPCDATAEQRTQVEHLKNQVSVLYTTTNILVAVGGAATAAGIVWFLVQPRASAKEKPVSVQPFASERSAGTRVIVHF